MLCKRNMEILDEEIRRLEEKELTWQTCDKLCTLYMLKERAQKHGGHEHEGHHMLTREDAIEWVDGMHGEDPSVPHGGKWTMEQLKPVAVKYGVPTEGERFWEFWAVMNAMYSDYYAIAKKYNQLNADFFADMTMAFINDKDAKPGKATRYYEHIVE